MSDKRIAILWTIVIVFISQLFHCAYTNEREQPAGKQQQQSHLYAGGGQLRQQQQHQFRQQQQHALQQQQVASQLTFQPHEAQPLEASETPEQYGRETYEELLSSSSGATQQVPAETDEPSAQVARQQSARERCRDLISLTLLSFRDLSSDERDSEEIDCANIRGQIAAVATGRQQQQQPQQPRGSQQTRPVSSTEEPEEREADSRPADEFPLPVFGGQQASASQQQPQQQASGRQNSRQFHQLAGRQFQPEAPSPAVPPRSVYVNQIQQLLLQQSLRQPLAPIYKQSTGSGGSGSPATSSSTTTTPPPSTQATTFESFYETTLAPTTSTTTTTTTTSTTPAPQPRIKIGGKRRNHGRVLRTSTTTTTTTTTTASPNDYADGSELSTDYYADEYDDQTQPTTTTTTTTSRPNRRNGSRKPKRRSTTSTTPKPSTTSTTLSPGYQPRPDGRIIDYMADPNFPRELKGADLTNYPFYISVPDKIDFECKGRHDGYYTNIDLHCQIYHHCAIGNRYDFLCPNYTLFDQTTFTCRFINTVDCDNSAKHFDRNNALYIEKDGKDASSYAASTAAPASSPTGAAGSSTTASTTTGGPTSAAPRLNIQLSQRSAGRSTPAPVSALSIVRGETAPGGASGAPNR